MASETYTQVAPNSTGNKIRNLQLTLRQSDGTDAVVQLQVVALADPEGNLLSLQPDRELLREVLREARIQTEILLRIVAACTATEIDRDSIVDDLEKDLLSDGELHGDER